MNNAKKINVNFSSLVGLKAELLKKQQEVNEAKLKSETNHTVPQLQKKKLKKIRNEKKTENSDKSEYIEDVDTHKKSKLMLEAKARLYQKLKKSKTTNENFLVDFTNKSDESEEEPLPEDATDEMLENEDDWVEYEDCFGRTRRCLKEDLPFMQEKDQLIKHQIISEKGIDPKTKDNVEQSCKEKEKESEIEIMRRKWEEQSKKLADKVNIHYQDVLFDEARTHGVGYYAFSTDEEQRMKQQENLFNLRKETERKQREIQELKQLKEKMEHNRLKAARIRQRVRAGLPIDTTEEEFKEKNDNESNQNISENMPDVSPTEKTVPDVKEEQEGDENKNVEKDEEAEKENKIKALGELLGKRTHWYEMSQEEWVDKCRKTRINEFGPMYENFKSAGYLNSENSQGNQPDSTSSTRNDEKLDSRDHVENCNEMSIDSYDIPLPPDFNVQQNLTEGSSDPSDTVEHRFNDATDSQIKPNRNIDEASIAAGLRYLRKKFEESQTT
ncbi:coiled-coil domain-containing protein 174 [Ceratina calcarata]|uniref:Coiled-coil domain-containing protein 174 n=1 Tax=Ceratina calcarata TaxID=156304 RepID=A0AAJ7NAE3_9HYME|nr:coiled-coil domain-containing protein 174 [Ceratina calcarata]XP_017884830.1 coiled-coil domain-containing protein 174 [Ceratina calcarata]